MRLDFWQLPSTASFSSASFGRPSWLRTGFAGADRLGKATQRSVSFVRARANSRVLELTRRFHEPARYRVMRFGLPLGLLLFLVPSVVLSRGDPPMPFVAFVVVFALITAQALVMSALTAHTVVVASQGIEVHTLRGRVSLSLSSIRRLELVDRRGVALPSRMVALVQPGLPLFVFDSIANFDDLLAELGSGASIRPSPMPAWRRIALLQWGAW